MKLLVIFLSVMVFIKTLSYGVFEIKNKNKTGGITAISLAILSLILPNVVVYIRGI